jgi:hypothetical protein
MIVDRRCGIGAVRAWPDSSTGESGGTDGHGHGVAAWFNDGSIDLGEHIVRAFQEARDLSSSNLAITKGKRRTQRLQEKARLP